MTIEGGHRASAVRRFVRPDGRWTNIGSTDRGVEQYSGTRKVATPHFGKVKQKCIEPRAGRTTTRLAEWVLDRGYEEVVPTRRQAGETRIGGYWRRFENWLCEFTPVSFRWPLAHGATPAQLDSFESSIGATLPKDVRESYLRHDGSAGVGVLAFVGEDEWVGLDQSLKHWRFFQSIKADLEEAGWLNTPKGPMKEVHMSPGWIPVSDNAGGDHLCIDLDPAKGGRIGQLFSYWHEYGAWRGWHRASPNCWKDSSGTWRTEGTPSTNTANWRPLTVRHRMRSPRCRTTSGRTDSHAHARAR